MSGVAAVVAIIAVVVVEYKTKTVISRFGDELEINYRLKINVY